ncbi:MAG: NAD-dependent epimerase/dehydratase family protein, partial [Bacteroidota bacterium]
MANQPNILLTGASGFIGLRYLEYNDGKYPIRTVSLQRTAVESVDFTAITTVIHMAGMAHQMQKIDDQIYFDVNFHLTQAFADAAKKAGVRHFIFFSTIKVFGEHHTEVLTLDTPCEPINDPYGQSKLDAERYLQEIQSDDFVVSIIRPPLVYGPRVKGNLIRFLHLGDKSFPLPFGGIKNRRTMVFLDNLIELCNHLSEQPVSGVFLAGDREPVSTTDLIRTIRTQMGKSPGLFPFPKPFIALLKMVKPEFAIRLFGSLEMDVKSTNQQLGF